MTPFSWGVALLCLGVVACAVPPCVRAVRRVRAFVEASAWGVRAVSTIPEYQVQPFAWIVKPKGADLFAETVTKIERTDEAAGQFLLISQQDDQIKPGTIRLNMEEWPALRQAIDTAFDAILADELHDFAPESNP